MELRVSIVISSWMRHVFYLCHLCRGWSFTAHQAVYDHLGWCTDWRSLLLVTSQTCVSPIYPIASVVSLAGSKPTVALMFIKKTVPPVGCVMSHGKLNAVTATDLAAWVKIEVAQLKEAPTLVCISSHGLRLRSGATEVFYLSAVSKLVSAFPHHQRAKTLSIARL